MDAWLTAVTDDAGAAAIAEKVRRHRPAELRDTCMTRDEPAVPVHEAMHALSDQCAALYPAPAGPRVAAGAPLAGDVLKCRLRPLAHEDYPDSPTDEQWRRLQDVFPTGVCDWSLPGVGQAARGALWTRFPLQTSAAGATEVATVPELAQRAGAAAELRP